MTDFKDFETVRSLVEAVKNDEIIDISVPVEILAKEGELLYDWVQTDLPRFEAANFDMAKIRQLPTLIGAARASEVKWENKQKIQSDAVKMWNAIYPTAAELLDETLDCMDYAFDDYPDLLKIVSDIRAGNTQADFVMDFNRTADLGNEKRELLEAANFDMSKIDKLAELGAKLGSILGQSDSQKLNTSPEKILRDKAYTLLLKTIRKIRKCGKYVCRGENERLKGYVSFYYKQKNRKARSTEMNTAEQPS